MRLTAFHASDGDCLLLTSTGTQPTAHGPQPTRILIDGGRKTSYEAQTRAVLGALGPGAALDVVCVSHIDEDHIAGILRLVEDEVDSRAFQFLLTIEPATNPAAAPPKPPPIGEVWHNGLFKLVGDDDAPVVESMLETVATILAGSPNEDVRLLASELDDLATGEKSSMELSRRLSTEQLGIPLNPPAGGQLMKRGTTTPPGAGEVFNRGSLKILLLGPSDDDIAKLRAVWQAWINSNAAALQDLHDRMLEDEKRLGLLSARIVVNPMLEAALGEGLADVTEATLASLMLLVEEGVHTVLLTGDGVSSEILDGLAHHGKLDANSRIHVNILKVQHHGAKANVTEDFVKRVTADHYVFCGNGSHHNPEKEVVEAFANARLTGIGGSAALGPATPFKFWFTSSSQTPGLTQARKTHMKKIEQAVAALRVGHEARMTAQFLKQGSFEIPL